VVNGLRIDRRTVVRPERLNSAATAQSTANALQQIAIAMALNNLLYS
jgi:hypothetical protein